LKGKKMKNSIFITAMIVASFALTVQQSRATLLTVTPGTGTANADGKTYSAVALINNDSLVFTDTITSISFVGPLSVVGDADSPDLPAGLSAAFIVPWDVKPGGNFFVTINYTAPVGLPENDTDTTTSTYNVLVNYTQVTPQPALGIPFTFNISDVPEPATIVLLGLGGLAMLRRRRCSK
jgi:hypothetical protein